jgi:hypothetical protein
MLQQHWHQHTVTRIALCESRLQTAAEGAQLGEEAVRCLLVS